MYDVLPLAGILRIPKLQVARKLWAFSELIAETRQCPLPVTAFYLYKSVGCSSR